MEHMGIWVEIVVALSNIGVVAVSGVLIIVTMKAVQAEEHRREVEEHVHDEEMQRIEHDVEH